MFFHHEFPYTAYKRRPPRICVLLFSVTPSTFMSQEESLLCCHHFHVNCKNVFPVRRGCSFHPLICGDKRRWLHVGRAGTNYCRQFSRVYTYIGCYLISAFVFLLDHLTLRCSVDKIYLSHEHGTNEFLIRLDIWISTCSDSWTAEVTQTVSLGHIGCPVCVSMNQSTEAQY